MDNIRVGVVGVGALGRHHARVYASLPGATLTGVVDTLPGRAEEIAKPLGAKAFLNHTDLLGRVDAVSIATPTTLHAEIGEQFLNEGVHVLVEKPLSHTLEDADRRKLVGELVALSAETPATAYVAGKLCDRLAAEPVASLRTRVAELSKIAPSRPRPPAEKTGAGDLTETELVTYSRLKTDEQKTRFLALRASRRSNSR